MPLSYTEAYLIAAVVHYRIHGNATKSSTRYGVPRSTLLDRYNGIRTKAEGHELQQRLSKKEENDLTAWIVLQGQMGSPPSHTQIRILVQRVYHEKGDSRPLGKKWMVGFYRRNPSIKTQRARKIDNSQIK